MPVHEAELAMHGRAATHENAASSFAQIIQIAYGERTGRTGPMERVRALYLEAIRKGLDESSRRYENLQPL